jgi:hypothetical protein
MFNDGSFFEPDEYMTDYLGKQSVSLIRELGKKREERLLQRRSQTATSTPFSEEEGSKKPDDPWFITVAFSAPHNPFQALISDYEKPEIQAIPSFIGRIYASMIHSLDRNVGRILEALKETSQYDNTIVVFTSDNGAAPYVGLQDLNAPFRGWKATLFEGGIRIPFFLQWPSMIKETAKKVNQPIIHIDILPSLYSIASKGIKLSEKVLTNGFLKSFRTDGVNFLSALLPSSKTPAKHHNLPSLSSLFNSSLTSLFHPHHHVDLSLAKNETWASSSVSEPSVSSSSSSSSFSSLASYLKIPIYSSDNTDLTTNHRLLYWRSGNYKTVRYGNYKLQVHDSPRKVWFYNLLIDPTERNNLINQLNDGLKKEERIHNVDDLNGYLQYFNSSSSSYQVYNGKERKDIASGSSSSSSSSFHAPMISPSFPVLSALSHLVASSSHELLHSLHSSHDDATATVTSSPSFFSHNTTRYRKYSEIITVSSSDQYNVDILLSNLLHVYSSLVDMDRKQAKPMWPALVEIPICIDKASMADSNCLLTDEYIIWAN